MNGSLTNGNKVDRGVTILLGAQWGDEGKGKVLDFLIGHHEIDIVARCQGGNNAGHTVLANGREYHFHLLPSGLASEKVLNIVGNGVVVNLDALFEELESNKIEDSADRLFISDSAHLVLPVHIATDIMRENALGQNSKLGTTKRGIGPAYSSKCFRNGIRLGELLYQPEKFEQNYRSLVAHFKTLFPDIELDTESDVKQLKAHAARLLQMGIVCNTTVFLHKKRLEGKSILVEGANGTLLDIDFGTYPFVTSSNSTVGGCITGLGIPPTAVRRVIGVVKAYQTRVGSGPFPTELLDADGQPSEEGKRLQEVGAEIGVTTRRKRRCGWLDLVLLRYSAMINGFTSLAVTKVDILDQFHEIKIAIGYELNGQQIEYPPATVDDWANLRVHYKTFEGWQSPTTSARQWEQLPDKCRAYLEFIQNQLGVPVEYIGVGKGREQLIHSNLPFSHCTMSWKETDPMTLWRTHSTLPVPESMVAPPRHPNENFANQVGAARKSIWSSLNEMNSEQRQLFFGRILHVWPYPWERRAITLPQTTLAFTNICCSGYITAKVCGDVFLVDPKIGWLSSLRSVPTLIPNVVVAFSTVVASSLLFHRFVYVPFIEHEGLLSTKSIFWRTFGINFMTATAVPCMFAPVAAHYHNIRILAAAGKPPIPANAVLDLIVTCWESTRSVWRKLPLLVAINFTTALLATVAMAWGCDRLHTTMHLDSELIRTLMDGSQKQFQEKTSVKTLMFLRKKIDQFNKLDKEIFFPPPMEAKDGPKWRDKTVDENEAQLVVGLSLPLRSWKDGGDDDE
ncbi:hypothetical protein niasHS_000631 [Heterodera schachtii]|uniref:Adenylosuccinate synthetase n=1 Tax=Heterodera schachtii TaxID=97005 RepID=A0ABD2K4T0_HETSC